MTAIVTRTGRNQISGWKLPLAVIPIMADIVIVCVGATDVAAWIAAGHWNPDAGALPLPVVGVLIIWNAWAFYAVRRPAPPVLSEAEPVPKLKAADAVPLRKRTHRARHVVLRIN